MVKLKFIIIGVVAVAAVAGITVGIVYATKGDGCKGIKPPSAANFKESNDGKVTLSWSLPDNIGECTAKYKVVVKVNDEEEDPKELEELEYVVENATPCSKVTASITTISNNGDESEKYDVAVYTVSSGVSKVKVDVSSVTLADNVRTVKWNVVSQGVCTVTYQLYIDGIKQEKPVSGGSTTFSNDLIVQCRSYQVMVKPVINGEEGGEGKSETVVGEVGDLSTATVNVLYTTEQADGWAIDWELLENYFNCDVTYQLCLDGVAKGDPVSGTTTTVSNDDLERCKSYTATVKPVIQGKEGGEGTGAPIERALGDVSTVTVDVASATEEQDGWIVTWGTLENYANCEVTYQLYLDGLEEGTSVTETTTIVSNARLEQCKTYKATVKPTIQGHDGAIGEGQDVTGAVGDISTVTVNVESATEDQNVWTVTWAPLENYVNCGVTYQLYLDDKKEGAPASGTTTTFSNGLLEQCRTYKVTVKPVIQAQEGGVGAGKDVTGAVGDISTVTVDVTSATEAENVWTVTWGPLENYENCGVTYQLYLDDTKIGTPVSEPTTTVSNDALKRCKSYSATVVPVIQENEGGKGTGIPIETGVGDISGVTTEVSSPTLASDVWTVEWTAVTHDQCSIKYQLYVDDVLKGGQISETATTFPNSDLGVCVNSKITVKPIIQEAEGTAGQAVDVQGEPPATDRVTPGNIAVQDDSTVTVAWTKNPVMEGCSFIYKVDLLRGTDVQSSTDGLEAESWHVPNFTTETCDLTAKVTATLEEPGDEVTIEQCDGIPAPRVITSW